MAEEIGVGYVRLLPSLRGFQAAATRELRGALARPARQAGKEAGDEIAKEGKPAGGRFAGGFRSGLRSLSGRIFHRILPGHAAEAAGQDAGERFGEGFSEGVSSGTGPQRDALGRFVSGDSAEDHGKTTGRRWFRGFSGHFQSGGPDLGKKLADSVLSPLAELMTVGTKPIAITAATAFSLNFTEAVIHGIGTGIAKFAHGFAAVLALLPAAAVAAGLALGTVKVALSGIGDALEAGLSGDTEKFAESLKGLAPEARTFVKGIVGFRKELGGLKRDVQGRFFAPLVDDVRPLGEIYLPIAQGAMGGLASKFGEVGSKIGAFLQTPETAMRLAFALNNGGTAAGNLVTGVGNLVRAFVPLVSVGSEFLPRLTAGADGATASLARMSEEAERTGRLKRFIQGGLDKLKSLWETGKQIGRILEDIGAIGATVFDALGLKSGGFLDKIEENVDKLREMVQSTEGMAVMTRLFEVARNVLGTLTGTISRVLTLLGETFGPVLPEILDFIDALALLKSGIIEVGFDVLEPVLRGIASALEAILPPATAVATWLSEHPGAVRTLAGVITTLLIPALVSWVRELVKVKVEAVRSAAKAIAASARTLASWVLTAAKAGVSAARIAASWVMIGLRAIRSAALQVAAGARVAAGWVLSAARATVSAARVAAAWLVTQVSAARATVVALAQLALQGARWLWMAATALAAAAQIALAWLISIGPIALVALAIAGLVALVVIHFDTIKKAIAAAFNWVKANWPTLLAILTGPIGLAVLAIVKNWDKIKAGVTAVRDWIGARFNDVVSFVKGLPGRISSAASGMWDGITGAFKSAINGLIGLWNGLHFPSLTVGGQDPLGSFGPSLPRATIGGWEFPNIPYLHTGGIFRTTSPGGEGLALLENNEGVFTEDQMAAMGSSAGPSAPGRLILEVRDGGSDLGRLLRKWIRDTTGGNVDVALGQGFG